MKIKHVISWTLCHINVLLEYHAKSVFFWQLVHLSIQILNPNPIIPFLLETGGNWRQYSTNTPDGWKFIKIAIFGNKTWSRLEFGKFFFKRPLLAVSNPGVQDRNWTDPGLDPGPGPANSGPGLDRGQSSYQTISFMDDNAEAASWTYCGCEWISFVCFPEGWWEGTIFWGWSWAGQYLGKDISAYWPEKLGIRPTPKMGDWFSTFRPFNGSSTWPIAWPVCLSHRNNIIIEFRWG